MAEISNYININACIGSGTRGHSDFPTTTDLLDHMNYLGIDRSFVWDLSARDLNPSYGNRKLLNKLTTSETNERLIPVFIIAPTDFYEVGVIDSLKGKLLSGVVRALQVSPTNFRMRHIERVLSKLAEYIPVLFWDIRDSGHPSDMDDFLFLAKQFPKMLFICTNMWGDKYSAVLDMMWRSKNIMVDTSMLHVSGSLELIVKHFGAERLVFGMGPKTTYGASVAALAHAQLSADNRNLIAHGNVERLVGIQHRFVEQSTSALLEEKPLWLRFRIGKAIEGVTVIDAHGHTAPQPPYWYLEDNNIGKNIPNLITKMDNIGVQRLLICSEPALFSEPVAGNLEGEDMCRQYKNRFSGYLVYNPLYEESLKPKLDEFFSRDFFVGFKIFSDYWRIAIDDPRNKVVWEYANKYSLPILIHTWNGTYSSPSLLKDVVGNYPNATFILGHSGGPDDGRREAENLVLTYPNVMLEFCGSFTGSSLWQKTIQKVGNDRILFGSDTCLHDLSWEMGRFLSIPLADNELIPILGENMKKILQKRKITADTFLK
jgi:uncharacterized protein